MTNVLTHPEPDTLNIDICEGERYDFFGTPYNQTGIYYHRKENTYMCDSVYVLNLRVNPYPGKTDRDGCRGYTHFLCVDWKPMV